MVLGFYEYIENIGGYFDENIDEAKIIQTSQECLKKQKKKKKQIDKIGNANFFL